MNEPTILVVEDDDAARAGLVSLLSPQGYRVIAVPDCKSALDVLARPTSPVLILLDMIVPGMNGWQFIARRSKDPDLEAIPFIIMTGLSIASEEWASAMGASALLTKPINVDVLFEAVRQSTYAANASQGRPANGAGIMPVAGQALP